VHAWLREARDAVAAAAAVPAEELDLDEDAVRVILDLARVAAHDSGDRTNAPLLCFLVGRAVERGADLEALAATLRR